MRKALQVIFEKCPSCNELAETIGVFNRTRNNDFYIGRNGWHCRNCGFQELADRNKIIEIEKGNCLKFY